MKRYYILLDKDTKVWRIDDAKHEKVLVDSRDEIGGIIEALNKVAQNASKDAVRVSKRGSKGSRMK